MNHHIQQELDHLLANYPQLSVCRDDILKACEALTGCYLRGGLIMTCGNGGSAADAEHVAAELMKSFKRARPISDAQRAAIETAFPAGEGAYLADRLQQGIPTISLVSQIALSSAFANDVAADMTFAQQVFVYGCAGDALIAISTSGNSKNVIHACATAKTFGVKTIAMTGEQGGRLREICDVAICVPASDTHRVQEYHLPVYHTLCAMLEWSISLPE
jgi:D-sedoheptulose 7-phosphate isomerase